MVKGGIQGKAKAIHHKNVIEIDSVKTYSSFGSRMRGSSASTFTIRSEDVDQKSRKMRCQSAFSKLQSLKNRKNADKPVKIFNSVNMFFDRKNTPLMKTSRHSI